MIITVVTVKPDSSLVKEIITLGDANTATLGFLPVAAFKQYAEQGGMLAAVNESDALLGYLLYRTPQRKNHATVAHLCVAPEYRGQGIAHKLFAELQSITRLLHGIDLHCRQDFNEASQLWQKLGFSPINEKAGRGKQPTVLIQWWYQHPHQSLFDLIPPTQQKIRVAIDANIFFGMADIKGSDEVKALSADWLTPLVSYVTTPELKPEINRNTKPNIRENYERKMKAFEELTAPPNRFYQVETELRAKYINRITDNARSDLAHLAWAIAASDVDFLVTCDKDLLGIAFDIYEKYQLRIFRPVDLVLHLHELEQIEEYKQVRLAGTQLVIRSVKTQEDTQLADVFQYTDSETQAEFLTHLRRFLSNPIETPCYVVEEKGTPVLLFCYQRTLTDLIIPLIRINIKAAPILLVRYFLFRFITLAASERKFFTCISEANLHEMIKQALQEDIFQHVDGIWIKPNLLVALPATQAAATFDEALIVHTHLRPYYNVHLQVLHQPHLLTNAKMISEVERAFHPAMITDAQITCVLIPIKQTWMSMWFDEELANATLFGADENRAFNREGVYYSSANRKFITPGRLLWYVTKNGHSASNGIRACARLDEVDTGSASELFQRYKHLGIYEWPELMQLAKNDPDAKLTAFRFSDPQRFKHPVLLSQLTQICKEVTGNEPPIYSPSSVPPEVFMKVYKIGMGLNG